MYLEDDLNTSALKEIHRLLFNYSVFLYEYNFSSKIVEIFTSSY